jgi:ribosome-binding factor A
MQGKRLERVNQLIKEEISMLLQRELKDPRLGFVTVTDVDVTADLKHAKVYVSVLGPEERWVSSFQALESARGFVWKWLRRHLDLRVTPDIAFRPDRSMEHAAHIQSLLAGLRHCSRGEEGEPS